MTTLLTNDFSTQLGVVRTFIQSGNPGTVIASDAFTVTTRAHKITLQAFEVKKEWIPDTMEFETSIGWRWFIEKVNAEIENLVIYCSLIDPTPETVSGKDGGEWLEALEIENKTHQLHLGTEDGMIMQSRAESENWMPKRFEIKLGFNFSFTEYTDFGFKTTIPDLQVQEKIYFHFLVATNPIKQSKQYPDERDHSTWYAVEQDKPFLDKHLAGQASS